ncbi:MarR family winged helix-turn-helix transcriptional regulator [Actinoallomurus acaciae]|uniref:MarR family winged helix-turn-helix transcriptional regulator n=1 Tax=Actinoallomurus acaciae TaxID=502577 RepID=A0ABV5YPZ7_9ACTN
MELFDEFVDAVLDLMRTARRTGGAAHTVRGDGVSVPQLVVLAAVEVAGGQGVTAVAERAGLAQPTVTRALAALERRSLVLRAPHASDGRTTSLALTLAGKTMLEETMRNVVARFGEVWESLAEDQREHAVRLVRSLARVTAELT